MSGTTPKYSSVDPNILDKVQTEIECLHATFERRGVNSRGQTDIYGRPFNCSVDAEHKANKFNTMMLLSVEQPHMRAFWASTLGFFTTFLSVFAPAALMPYLKKAKEDGGLGLTKSEISGSGAAAVGSTIFMRVLAGPMIDMLGARYTFMTLLAAGAPGVLGMMFVQDAAGLIVCRLIIGIGLATFVPCQVWNSQMFSKSVVGVANATAGGWGNLGGGVTQLIMPAIMTGILGATGSIDTSWRLCFILPLAMHFVAFVVCWSGRDLPDGNYKELETSGAKKKTKGASVAKVGFSNVNAYLMLITYGLCFGVELTMNNKVVLYFYTYYGLTPFLSGVLGSCFGLMNIFARSWGGLLSDAMNKRFGMRGRLWSMWVVQTIEGVLCLCMGIITVNTPGPDDYPAEDKITAVWKDTSERFEVVYEIIGEKGQLGRCASDYIETPMYGLVNGTETIIPTKEEYIMIGDPWDECVRNSSPVGLTLIIMILFSCTVQMAEGLHYGVVPYISRPALGIVSGMIGAGGNLGAVVSGLGIMPATLPIDQGFIHLGIVIMTVSLIMHFVYFPEHGCMLLPAGALGSYDPQLIKPDAGQVGADQLDFAQANVEGSKNKPEAAVTVTSSA